MSRTFRNKNTIPHGWTVRDDGCPYPVSNMTKPGWWSAPAYRRSPYRCEKKWARKETERRFRNQVKDRLRNGDWDGIPDKRIKTSGWMTW